MTKDLPVLSLFLCIQEDLKEMKKKEERRTKEMAIVLQQNKDLIESQERSKEEVTELQKQLTNYERDKSTLAVCLISYNFTL